MSFIRRADGTTVYSGGHVSTRGSLASIRHGGGPNDDYFSQMSDEDLEWEKRVMATAVTLCDNLDYCNYDDYFDQDEYEPSPLLSNLWGIYKRDMCQHLTVGFTEGKGCFRRSEKA